MARAVEHPADTPVVTVDHDDVEVRWPCCGRVAVISGEAWKRYDDRDEQELHDGR